jgi:serine/threonine protein kinase
MEYCSGGDLQHYYKKPEFTKAEFARVGTELLSGVLYLHARGIAQ